MTGPHQVRGPRRGHLTLSLSLTLHLQAGARPKDLASPSALLLPIPWTSRPQHTSTSATAGPLPCALALSRPQVPRPRCLPSRTPGSQHPCCSEVARLSPCNTPHPRHPAQHPPPPTAPCVGLAGWAGGRAPPTQMETGPESRQVVTRPGGAGGRREGRGSRARWWTGRIHKPEDGWARRASGEDGQASLRPSSAR